MGETLQPIATPSLPLLGLPEWRTANQAAREHHHERAYPTPPPSSKRDSSANTSGSSAPPTYSPLLPFFDPAQTTASVSAPRPAAPAANPPRAWSKETHGTRRAGPTLDEFLGSKEAAPRDAPSSSETRLARRPSAASSASPHGSSVGTLPSPSPVPTAAAAPSWLAKGRAHECRWSALDATFAAHNDLWTRPGRADLPRVASAPRPGPAYRRPWFPKRSSGVDASTRQAAAIAERQQLVERFGDRWGNQPRPRSQVDPWSHQRDAEESARAKREERESVERRARARAIATEVLRHPTTDAARPRTTDASSWEQQYPPNNASSTHPSWSYSTIPRPSSSSSSSRAEALDARASAARDPHNPSRSLSSSSLTTPRPSTLSPLLDQRHLATREEPSAPMYRRSNGAHIHRSAYHDTPPPVTERYRVERDHERADIPPPVAERYRVERIERDRERVERPAAVAAAAAPPPSNRGKRGPRGPISETSFTAKEHAGASRIPWTLTSARSHNTMYLSKAPASLSPSAPPAVVTTAPVVGSMAGPARSPSASLAPAMMLPAEFRTSAIPSVPAARYESAASSHAVPLVPSTTSTYPPPSRIRQRGDHDTVGHGVHSSTTAPPRSQPYPSRSRSASPDRRRYSHMAHGSTSRPSVVASTSTSESRIRPSEAWPTFDPPSRAYHPPPPPSRRPAQAASGLPLRERLPPSPPSALDPPLARAVPPASHPPKRAPVPSSTGQPVRPRWTAAELGLSPDVDDTPKRPFSILADLATRWSSGTNLECRCTRPHGDAVDELVSDNEAKHAAEWCRKHVPMWIPGIPSCRYLRNERRARGGKLTAAEGFLEAAQYLLALEHIGTDEMGCGFPCAVQLERLSGIAKENLEIVFDQDPDTNSLMCVVFAATFCDFVDVRDLPLLMDRPKSSSPTPETDANDDASPSTPFLYIAVANWYACGVIGNDDRVFNPDLSFLPGQADLLSELKGTVHLPVHELPPLQGISLRCMAWVLLQELLSLARKIVKDKTLRLHERLAKLDELHFKWTAAINLAFTRQQTDLGRAVEADSVLQFLRVELCALDLFVADAMLIFALNRELSTDDYALLAVCANAHMRAYAKKHWQNKVDAAQSLLRGLVWLSKCKSVFPTVATLAYVLEVAKTVVEISGVSYKMRVASPPNLRTSFDAVAAWVEGMVLQKAEVYPYPLSLTRHFVKSSQQAVDSWEQWGVVRANAERMGQVVPVIGQVPLSVQAEGRNARRADAARKHRPEHRPEGVQPPPIDKAEEVVWGKEEPAPRTPLTPVPTARQTNVIASEPETEVAVKTEPQDIVDGAEGMDIDVIGEAESGPEQAEVVAPVRAPRWVASHSPMPPPRRRSQTTQHSVEPETRRAENPEAAPRPHQRRKRGPSPPTGTLSPETAHQTRPAMATDVDEVRLRKAEQSARHAVNASHPRPSRSSRGTEAGRAVDPAATASTPSHPRTQAPPPPSSSPRRSSRLEGRETPSPRRGQVAPIRFWSSSEVSTAQLVPVPPV